MQHFGCTDQDVFALVKSYRDMFLFTFIILIPHVVVIIFPILFVFIYYNFSGCTVSSL